MINLVSKTKNKINEYIPDFKKFMNIDFFYLKNNVVNDLMFCL